MKFTLLTILLFSTMLLYSQKWESSFESAKQIAQKENKNIILVFSGSDWCAPCIKLDQKIWQSDVFQKAAKNNWVLFKADFPRKNTNKLSDEKMNQNKKLADLYNKNGIFPLVLILDAKGKIIGQTGYMNLSPEEYIIHLLAIENK